MYHDPLSWQVLFQGVNYSLVERKKTENLIENDMICKDIRVNDE